MHNRWFSNLPKDKQQERKQLVEANKFILDILSEIVYNMGITEERVVVSDYDSPSWSHKQADRNGYLRALRDIESLINLKET